MRFSISLCVSFLILSTEQFNPSDAGLARSIVNIKTPISPIRRSQIQRLLCPQMKLILRKKDYVIKRLHASIQSSSHDDQLPESERNWQTKVFTVFEEELNDGEQLIYEALNWLEEALSGNFKEFIQIKKNSKRRLDVLQNSVLKEQQEYNEIVQAESERLKNEQAQQDNPDSHIERVVDGLLQDVAKAADVLEKGLDDHIFDKAVADDQGKGVEAVIRLPSDGNQDQAAGKTNSNESHHDKDELGMKLVDSHDNQYVMSKAKDSTVPHEDRQLIQDIIAMVFVSFLVSVFCNVIHLPCMFGYIIGGIILGPSGVNFLKSTVQVETIGQFGVFFILFTVGLEFSPERLKKVWKIAVCGSVSMMFVTILFGLLIGIGINSTANESAFLAACLSLSSTPLIVKFLATGNDEKDDKIDQQQQSACDYRQAVEQEHGPILLGILVMQDVLLGILIALLPIIAGIESTVSTDVQSNHVRYLIITGKLLFAFLAIVIITVLLALYVVGPLLSHLLKSRQTETVVLAAVVLAFSMLMLTDWFGISMELGCFLAGVIVSAQGSSVTKQIEHLVEPIRDFLGCIFFCSIGLHVFPSFMMFEITVLTSLTLAVVGFKFLIGVIVLHFLLSETINPAKWIVSAGLAQVSEYAFVLGSRALKLGLISREVYLLVLGLTTLSLLLAPFLWRATWFVFNTQQRTITAKRIQHYRSLENLSAPEEVIVEPEKKHGHIA